MSTETTLRDLDNYFRAVGGQPGGDMSKHTPGPLVADENASEIIWSLNPYGHGMMHVLEVRGWGHLTGKGACALKPSEAIEIQDATAQRVVACVNACSAFADPEQDIPALVEALRGLIVDIEYLAEDGAIEYFAEDGALEQANIDTNAAVKQARAALDKATPHTED